MELFFSFISSVLSNRKEIRAEWKAIDWRKFYYFAQAQAVLGIVLEGMDKYGETLKVVFPKDVLLQWIGDSELIKQQNRIAFKRSAEIIEFFAQKGFKACILKGQGNALMYDNPYSRTSGDIDIWIDGSREEINNIVRGYSRPEFEQSHHIDFPIYNDIEVEAHYIPAILLKPSNNRKFQEWCQEQKGRQMTNKVELPDGYGEIYVPTADFNTVFQMAHMMDHFLTEGIGLRHFIDYYHVLKNYHTGNLEITETQDLFKEFGLLKFARGVMWLEKVCLGLDDIYLIVEPDEKTGEVILEEMLEGGNFGQYDERYKVRKNNYIARGLADYYRLLKLARAFPVESMWKMARKIENQRWKLRR